jgi:hypothetical protein
MPTGKRKEPMPTEEEPPKPMRLLSPEEIEDHRQFVEDEEPGVGSEAYLRFLPAADAEQIRSITRGIDVRKLKQKSKELLEKYDAQGYVEVPDVVVPPAALRPPTTPPGQVARKIDFESVRLKIREFKEKYDAKGFAEDAVVVVPPAMAGPPRRVSEERVKRLRRFMEQSFRPVPERVIRSRFFSESQGEVIRNFNRVCLKAEAELKAHTAKALQEYDAKGYLECTIDGKIKVSEPSCGSST